jgi:hypothetical protein
VSPWIVIIYINDLGLSSKREERGKPCAFPFDQPHPRIANIGASEFLCRAVHFGILEQPSIPFSSGEVLNPIPQTPEHLALGREDLRAGFREGLYEKVTTGEAERIRSTGAMISSSFVVWQDGPEGRKGRFVVNLSKQSKHWLKGIVRMDTLPEYALELEHGEKMVSFDIQAVCRHFRLAP